MKSIDVFKMAMLKKGISITKLAEAIKEPADKVEKWLYGIVEIDHEQLMKLAEFLGVNKENVYDMNFLQRIDSAKVIQVVAIKKIKRENTTENNIAFVETEYWDMDGNLIGLSV